MTYGRICWDIFSVFRLSLGAVVASLFWSGPLLAEMWGTGSSDGDGLGALHYERSSIMHLNYGIVAGQVNAAEDGMLYQGTSISISSVGSQTVISNTISGHNNIIDVDANQTASNTGAVSNGGEINVTP